MTAYAVSEEQSRALTVLLSRLTAQIEAEAILVSDYGGNILAHVVPHEDESIQTVAALAAGAFAATRELARFVREPEFVSIFHRGRESSIFMQCLASNYLVLAVVNKKTAQGLVKLCVERMAGQLEMILAGTVSQSLIDAGALTPFELDSDTDVFEEESEEDEEIPDSR